MKNKYLRDLVPLVVICLVAALCLAVFNQITKGPIEENSLRAAQETRARLLSAAVTFEEVALEEGSGMKSCYAGLDADGNVIGHVVQTAVNGYGGEIIVTLGMDTDNVITGIDVGGDNFSETAGLGALAKEPAFTDQFIGKKVPLKLIKGSAPKAEDTIDAISGATITSTAVNGGVNLAGKFVMDLGGGAASANTASVQGFAGPVAVTLELDDAGAISSIVIGDDFFNETEGYGRKALEDAFQQQFIGKVPPLALSDIDTIAGATVTSTAVVNAINQVHAQLNGESPVAEAAPAQEDTAPEAGTVVAAEPVPGVSSDETAGHGSAQGFVGPVAVAIELDEAGAISAITIGDESFVETDGFGKRALEDAFKAQFIGKVPPLEISDIDALAGATVTSNAVINALNQAYADLTGAPAAEAESAPEAVEVMAAERAVVVSATKAPDATSEATSEATAEAAAPERAVVVSATKAPDVTSEATSEATAEAAAPERAVVVSATKAPDATSEATSEATAEAAAPERAVVVSATKAPDAASGN